MRFWIGCLGSLGPATHDEEDSHRAKEAQACPYP